MPRKNSLYDQQVEMLKKQNVELQDELEGLMKQWVVLRTEYALLKTEYDEKLVHLIGDAIRLKHIDNDGSNPLQEIEEDTMNLISAMGALMRIRKIELDELHKVFTLMQESNSQTNTPDNHQNAVEDAKDEENVQ